MRVEFLEREIRTALFATGVEPERRIYLEAIGIELYIVGQRRLEEIAAAKGVNPIEGISRKVVRESTRTAPYRFESNIGHQRD